VKFKPAEDYENLKRQACALATIVTSQEHQLLVYSEKVEKLERELHLVGKTAIEELRSVNERLTNLLEP
jgi:hypothetical protein